MERGQPNRSDSQRPSAQFLPADAVISTEMRLTTRDLYPKRTAGPYPPDSHCQIGLLEGGSAILGAQRGALTVVETIATNQLHEYDKRNAYEKTDAERIEKINKILGSQVRGALIGVDTTGQLGDYEERNVCERNDVGFAGFDEARVVTRNDIVSTRDQRQHEARNAADDVTAMPHRHAEIRERDRYDGYAPGYLIGERDERRCSDQMMHVYRQSDWTGYAQQSAMCSSLEAIAASNPCAADAEQRADDMADYARRIGKPPRPASGQSQRYDGHPIRRSTSTEIRQWVSYVADEVPPPQRHDRDRLEPCMADLSLKPSEQNFTFRENVLTTATQTVDRALLLKESSQAPGLHDVRQSKVATDSKSKLRMHASSASADYKCQKA